MPYLLWNSVDVLPCLVCYTQVTLAYVGCCKRSVGLKFPPLENENRFGCRPTMNQSPPLFSVYHIITLFVRKRNSERYLGILPTFHYSTYYRNTEIRLGNRLRGLAASGISQPRVCCFADLCSMSQCNPTAGSISYLCRIFFYRPSCISPSVGRSNKSISM